MKHHPHFPEPGDQVQRWGNACSRWFGRTVLRIGGWRIEPGPPNLSKFVAVVAPHTSNVDFFVGMAAILAMGMRASWMGKHTLFRPAFFGRFLEYLGGIPINRANPVGLVDQVVEMFEQREHLILGVTPEGTRKKVDAWKTGFHRIARAAGVPIVLVSFDYRTRTLAFGRMIRPGEDLDADLDTIRDYYSTITAKRPERFTLPPDRTNEPES